MPKATRKGDMPKAQTHQNSYMTTHTETAQATWLDPMLAELNTRLDKVKLGGGAKRLDDQRKKGKLTARERIAQLIDNEEESLEIGAFVGDGMYAAEGGCPSGGVVVVLAKIHGRSCVVVANDASVKAGAWFPITAKKNLRAQEIAMENRLPLVYLVDSAGVFLPMQHEVFADKEHFGRIFRNNAKISAMGIVQIAAIMGSCVAGGAYLPIMSDEAFIVEGNGSVFLAGSFLVKSAIGEDIDNETLGGAKTHTEISGVTDNRFPDDKSCLAAIRHYFSLMGAEPKAGFDRIAESRASNFSNQKLTSLFPGDRVKPYDTYPLLALLLDSESWQEYKPHYGKSLVCGFGRVDGWAVGIVANQRKMIKNGKGEMQIGGVIYSDSADKAARFIMNCNQRKIPLVFLHDVTGFMVGSRSEHNGIIKDGAKLVSAVANSVVPKITILIGNSYGAGNYAMCGKAYDPRLIFAWPTAQLAVMSGASASKTLVQIQKAKLEAKGEKVDASLEAALIKEITDKYNEELSPYYAAARLWTDGIIDPADTRKVISMAIEAANHAPITEKFNLGIIQT